jgi:tRNA threonylcarbamoyladenosine biosynthesis protein TsaE
MPPGSLEADSGVLTREISLPDEQATLSCAARLAELLAPPKMIFLYGELGTGKTTFARGFIRAKGHRGKVRSPTYTLFERYTLPSATVLHLDLYRLGGPLELEALAIRDFLDEHSFCLVEWPERAAGYLGAPHLQLHFHYAPSGRTLALSTSLELDLTRI